MQATNEKDPHGRALIEKNDLGGGVRPISYSSKTKMGGTFIKLFKNTLVLPVTIYAALRQVLPMLFLHTRFALFCNHKIS